MIHIPAPVIAPHERPPSKYRSLVLASLSPSPFPFRFPPSPICLLSPVFCLLSSVFCLLSSVFCLLSPVFCLLSPVFCLLSPVFCLLSPVFCLLSSVFSPFPYLDRWISVTALSTNTRYNRRSVTPLGNTAG